MLPAIPAGDGPGNPPIDALDGDAPFLVWIGASGFTALELALPTLDAARYAVLRIGNPLKASLSPHRLLLQFAPDEAPEASEARGDEAGHLLRVVAARAAGRPFLLVVVEQAETLTQAALTLLQLLPGLRGPGIPTVRVAFHGTSAFCDMLRDPRFQSIRGDVDNPTLPPAVARLSNRRRRRAFLGVGSAAALLVVAALLLAHAPSQVTVTPVPALSLPAETTASPLRPEAATPPMPAEPPLLPVDVAPPAGPAGMPPAAGKRPPVTEAMDPAVARARLFLEFNAFVEARGLSGRLSRSEREILFSQYLASRQNAAATSPANRTATAPAAALPPQAAPAVVVFFRTGPLNAELRANEDAAVLRRQFADVTLRPATDGPRESTVRYFRPEDQGLAITIALILPPTKPDWQVEDLSAAPDHPAHAAIEVWLGNTP